MEKLIWNRGGAASPSLAVSYVLGSGGCGGIGTTAPNRQKRSASEIELKLGKLSLRKNSVSMKKRFNITHVLKRYAPAPDQGATDGILQSNLQSSPSVWKPLAEPLGFPPIGSVCCFWATHTKPATLNSHN